MSQDEFWFGFRQTSPPPPGQAIACGPFSSYEQAKIERERSKAWDCEVSTPFQASTKDEADKKATKWFS